MGEEALLLSDLTPAIVCPAASIDLGILPLAPVGSLVDRVHADSMQPLLGQATLLGVASIVFPTLFSKIS